ncbi:MAG: carbohydrate ABC transporter permease [Clostridia bacterium]|jgi:ABC-type glycerol-3-phosphate transport system permease component|nr:carbohydrate ABC transporter permease [Clostridia bacterium]
MLQAKMKSKEVRERLSPVTVFMLAVLVLFTLSLFIPLLWALLTSFKNQSDFRINIIGLPKQWVWNFSYVLKKFTVPVQTEAGEKMVGMGMMYVNSLLYSVGCAFFGTLVPCITAYMCARFPYKFSKIVHTTVIVVMIIPIVGALPAEIRMAMTLKLYDHVWGLWIMKANFLGLYFLVFYGVFKALPMAYTEAAKIDGAGNLGVLIRIVLPLVRNTFFTVMLINFITFWNDYQTPLIFMPSHPTVALGMFHMASTTISTLATIPMRMTGAMLLLVPILIVFLLTHKRLMGNLTMGGIKG